MIKQLTGTTCSAQRTLRLAPLQFQKETKLQKHTKTKSNIEFGKNTEDFGKVFELSGDKDLYELFKNVSVKVLK